LGEQPTGAFPSSHVGLTVIFLMIIRNYSKPAFYIILPIAILLVFATVYIKAHYAVDVVVGLITGVLFYMLTSKIYSKIFKTYNIN
jgi:membrane-associated phospholipid phosphatase